MRKVRIELVYEGKVLQTVETEIPDDEPESHAWPTRSVESLSERITSEGARIRNVLEFEGPAHLAAWNERANALALMDSAPAYLAMMAAEADVRRAPGNMVADESGTIVPKQPTRTAALAAGTTPPTHSQKDVDDGSWAYFIEHNYAGQVALVFKGYGDDINPVKMAEGLGQLAGYYDSHGLADTGKVVAQGMLHAYTAFATTSDAREFGQSFGTVLATAAPAIKRLPNRTVYRLEGPWLTPKGKLPTGATFVKVSKWSAQDNEFLQVGRLDLGRLDNRPKVPPKLVGKLLPHMHHRGPGGIDRQRPWEGGPGSQK